MDPRKLAVLSLAAALLTEETVWPTHSSRPPPGPWLYYCSGSNQVGEIRAWVDVGQPFGISTAIKRKSPARGVYWWALSEDTVAELVRVAGRGVPLFVDSGAFSEVDLSKSPPEVVLPISDSEWRKRLRLYLRLADAYGTFLSVVVPDLVGDQGATLDRMLRYSRWMQALRCRGVNLLVPVQPGPLPPERFFEAALVSLGMERGPSVVPSFPMVSGATPMESIERFLHFDKPARIHFMGLGPLAKAGRASTALGIVRRLSPETFVSMDSVAFAGHSGYTGGPGVQVPADFPSAGTVSKVRAYTVSRAEAELLLQASRLGTDYYVDMMTRDGWGMPDYTDCIARPSAWLTRPRLRVVAAEAGLGEHLAGAQPEALAKAFCKHPDEFLQLPMHVSDEDLAAFMRRPDEVEERFYDYEDGPRWYDDLGLEKALDDAWRAYRYALEGAERTRLAVAKTYGPAGKVPIRPAGKPVLIIQCGDAKLPRPAPVNELYTGPFWSTYRARRRESPTGMQGVHPELDVYVLSAEHGLVSELAVLEPYNSIIVPGPQADYLKLYRKPKVSADTREVSADVLARRIAAQAQGLGLYGREVYFVGGLPYGEALQLAGVRYRSLSDGGMLSKRKALSEFLKEQVRNGGVGE